MVVVGEPVEEQAEPRRDPGQDQQEAAQALRTAEGDGPGGVPGHGRLRPSRSRGAGRGGRGGPASGG